MSDASFTEVMHPRDPAYMIRRDRQIQDLLKLSTTQLDRQLRYMMSQPAPRDESGLSRTAVQEIANSPVIPDATKDILGSATGSGLVDGSALIRQDLEPTLYASFIE